MSKPNYKYHIKHRISLLPREISIAMIQGVLSTEHGISKTTFYHDSALVVGDDFLIPTDRLHVYAGIFGCTIEELQNYQVKKIRPISDRKLSTLAKSVVTKSKMVKGTAKVLIYVALAMVLSSCVSYAGLGKCPTNRYTPIHRTR